MAGTFPTTQTAMFEQADFDTEGDFREALAHVMGGVSGGASRPLLIVRRLATPLGPMVAGATDCGLCLLEFGDRGRAEAQLRGARRALGCDLSPGEHPHLTRAETELAEYFAGRRLAFTVPLILAGTAFQTAVWTALRAIPFGETVSYEALARRIGRPSAQRAVGRANGQNRLAVIVPCHRVIGRDGGLTGYGGGLWRKHALLELERRDLPPTS